MKLNNSIKLAIANFSLFWKLMLYKIIALGVGVLFVLPVFGTVKTAFVNAGVSNIVGEMFKTAPFQNVPSFCTQLFELFNSCIDCIVNLATNNTFVFVYLLIILVIIIPFLFKLSDVPASEVSYSYMSSLNKNSFTANYISMFDKSVVYSILRTIFEIPFIVFFCVGAYGILSLGQISTIWSILSPFIFFVFIVIVLAFNNSLFNGWAPSIVVFNCSALKGISKGLTAVKRNFFSVLSSFIVVETVMVCLLYLFGLYSLIVVVPFLALVVAVFGQVLFFESQGMDYYISLDKIITAKKLECSDSIRKVKNII